MVMLPHTYSWLRVAGTVLRVHNSGMSHATASKLRYELYCVMTKIRSKIKDDTTSRISK